MAEQREALAAVERERQRADEEKLRRIRERQDAQQHAAQLTREHEVLSSELRESQQRGEELLEEQHLLSLQYVKMTDDQQERLRNAEARLRQETARQTQIELTLQDYQERERQAAVQRSLRPQSSVQTSPYRPQPATTESQTSPIRLLPGQMQSVQTSPTTRREGGISVAVGSPLRMSTSSTQVDAVGSDESSRQLRFQQQHTSLLSSLNAEREAREEQLRDRSAMFISTRGTDQPESSQPESSATSSGFGRAPQMLSGGGGWPSGIGVGSGEAAGQGVSQGRPLFGTSSGTFSAGPSDPRVSHLSANDFRSGTERTHSSSSGGGGVRSPRTPVGAFSAS